MVKTYNFVQNESEFEHKNMQTNHRTQLIWIRFLAKVMSKSHEICQNKSDLEHKNWQKITERNQNESEVSRSEEIRFWEKKYAIKP